MIFTRAIGIDLGTTNSAVAMLDPNDRDLVMWKDAQERATLPSCVWFDPRTKEVVVGSRAYARRGTAPEPISSIKRSMGTQTKVALGGEQQTPAQISSLILRELKTQMQRTLAARVPAGTQYEVSSAIVTVPAYFGLPAIEATRQAGEMAGLQVTELLHEPTAAAIYYSWKHDLGDGTYMVYDLGGGTFDVSILQRTAGEFLVLGISGDNFLGGDDFDRRLAEHIRQVLVDDGYELQLDSASEEDRLRFNQLVAIAERAKKELSGREEIVLRDQGTLRDKAGSPVVVETSITRTAFAGLISDLLDRTIVCCERALALAHEKAGTTIESLDHILLVGGSTYVPAVMDKVAAAFCSGSGPRARCAAPIRDEPETAVALGAALRASTSGLGVTDEWRVVRLWFLGTGVTRRTHTTIGGRVEVLDASRNITGSRIRLLSAADEVLGDAPLASDSRFSFPHIDLVPESLNEFRFQIVDACGAPVATLGRSITHSAQQKEAVGRALSTAVLSKPIVLEGTDGDRLVRHVLLAEGASLPARAQYTFAITDPAGDIRMPIYQESRIIKELRANAGKTPVGTPVEVCITCDEQVRIEVSFSVNGNTFGGAIAAPPPENVPTEAEIEGIEQNFLQILQLLEEEDAARLESAFLTARGDLDEARAGGDYAKVIQRRADLDGLVRDARLAEPLRPPLSAVDKNAASCRELLPQALKVRSDLGKSLPPQHLDNLEERARQAWKKRDRQEYEDAAHAISMTLQFLVGVTRARGGADNEIDVAVRAVMALERARQVTQFVLIGCLVQGQGQFVGALTKQLEEIGALEERAAEDPVRVVNQCQVMITEAQRIHRQIAPEEKRNAELEGLLRMDRHRHATAAPTGGLGHIQER
jgi:molecular chaperone DnaK